MSTKTSGVHCHLPFGILRFALVFQNLEADSSLHIECRTVKSCVVQTRTRPRAFETKFKMASNKINTLFNVICEGSGCPFFLDGD